MPVLVVRPVPQFGDAPCPGAPCPGYVAYRRPGTSLPRRLAGLPHALAHLGNPSLRASPSTSRATQPTQGDRSRLSFVCARRSYLTLPGPRLRAALVRLATSEHPLAIEALRRLPGADSVPREWRACSFCRKRGSIEDEPHVLLLQGTTARHEATQPRKCSRGFGRDEGAGHCWTSSYIVMLSSCHSQSL